jgi:hypothetical protein
MRDKHLLRLFLALNVALAACFVIYLFLSANNQPKVTSSSFAPLPAGTNTQAISSALGAKTNSPSAASNQVVAVPATNAPAETNSTSPQPVFAQKKFGWEQIESEEYKTYLDSLRAVGCPEDKIRYIVITDINELFSKKRLKEAVTHDIQWWRSEPEPSIAGALQQKGRGLEEERRALVEKYLGSEAAEMERGEAMLWSNVQLTGPVLGSLPPEVHNTVQEICGRSIERHQGAFWARVNEGQPLNNVEMARLREQTRADLRKVLNSDGMEEFLLRYSHNSHQLRSELRGFDPTPDEFRKIFRGIDTLEHQLQIEFGGLETLSPQQRERHLAQRDAAIREALGPKRYQDYLMIKDPLFRQAQATAMQYGAPTKVILPIYQAAKANELKRQRILSDAALTPQQKSEALQAVNQEQQRSVQQIVTDVRNRQ